MSYHLHISISDNTSTETILFFDKLVLCDFISLAKEDFYKADRFDGSYEMPSLPFHIDTNKETLTVEYEEEISWDEFNGPTLEWKEKVYHFKDSLHQTLSFHAKSSMSLIKKKMTDETFLIKSKKETLKNIVFKIIDRCNFISTDTKFLKYKNDLLVHYSRIIGFIYHYFPDLAPKRTTEINDLISIYKKDMYSPATELGVSIIDEIINFCEPSTKNICFEFDNKIGVKADFKNFYYGQFEKINKPINISVNKVESAYYLIYKLSQYLNYKETEIMKSDIFRINGKMFTVKSAYSAKNRINNRKHNLKWQIDDIFIRHLS